MCSIVIRTVWLASALALGACQTAAPSASVLPFEGSMIEAGERSGAPGIVAAVLRDGEVVEMFAWGGADCSGTGAANPFASYEIGSISKHITAVALLQLWERGQVELDAPVGRYLDDIPEAWRAVTLRQLLTHTGGVPDYEEAGGYGVYETTPTPAEVYAILDDPALEFEPGAQWRYSNTGYFMLSLVVQRVSGERFGDYLRDRLFAPHGLDDTFMGGYAPDNAVMAQGCRPGEAEGAALIPVRPISEASTFGAGGISSTLEDWADWDDALFEGRLLQPRSMHALLTPQHLSTGEDTGYAFGIVVEDFRGVQKFGHSGQTQGFVADYAHYPERGFSTIVFGNAYGGGVGAVSRALALRVMPELSHDRLPPAADPDARRTEQASRALRQLVLNEAPLDLLSADLQPVATSERYAGVRASLRPYAEKADGIVFLRSDAEDDDVVRDIYRIMLDGETQYLNFYWRNGALVGLRREDE